MPTDLPNFAPSSLPDSVGVAVSGGADSVALLRLLADARPRPRLVVIHFNHQLRGADSDADETFVRALADRLDLTSFVRRRDELAEQTWPANPSAKYRAMRLAVYREAMQQHTLAAIALAHHADDQAETVMLRLVRGGGLASLRAMSPQSTLIGVPIIRPLLRERRATLRHYLDTIGQPWREDTSNTSPRYRRNVVRRVLANDATLTPLLCTLASQAEALRRALDESAPQLCESFARDALRLPSIVAEHAARRWLVARGAPSDDVSAETCLRLICQATDATAPARQHFPGGLTVRRRNKQIFVDRSLTPAAKADLPRPGSA